MSQPDRPRYLAVGRLRKPHGLKGEFAIFPLTAELVVERSRGYHCEWLVKFRGVDNLDLMGQWRGQFLGAPAEELTPPAEGEVYLHELEGFAVRDEDGTAYGLVSGLLELPSGITLEIQGPKREFLLPFIKEFVREVRREERLLVVVLPEGLLD